MSGRGNDKCKGPEVSSCLAGLGNIEEACVAETEQQVGDERDGGDADGRAFVRKLFSLCFRWEPREDS